MEENEETEEAKRRGTRRRGEEAKMSERTVNRITHDFHNEKTQQQYSWSDHEKTWIVL
jgi:hypothetical protein